MSGPEIDRVAQAIYNHAASKPPGQPSWEEASEEVRDWLRGHAQAAIDAMGQPVTLQISAFQAAAIGFWSTSGVIASVGLYRAVSGLTTLFWTWVAP